MPSERLHQEGLLSLLFRRVEDKGTGINRNRIPVFTEQAIERKASHLSRDVPEADIEWTVGVYGDMMPPAIIGAEVLPVTFAGQRVLAQKERLEGGGGHMARGLHATPRKPEGVALHPGVGAHGDDQELEIRATSHPHGVGCGAAAGAFAEADLDFDDLHRCSPE